MIDPPVSIHSHSNLISIFSEFIQIEYFHYSSINRKKAIYEN